MPKSVMPPAACMQTSIGATGQLIATGWACEAEHTGWPKDERSDQHMPGGAFGSKRTLLYPFAEPGQTQLPHQHCAGRAAPWGGTSDASRERACACAVIAATVAARSTTWRAMPGKHDSGADA